VAVAAGPNSAPQITTYSYYETALPNGAAPLAGVTHPDGSWELYESYDANGNPTTVFSSYGDVSTNDMDDAREMVYTYDPEKGSGRES